MSQWPYRWTKNYGSPRFKISNPDEKGPDDVASGSVELSVDRKSVLFRIAELKPVMQMAIPYDQLSASGAPLKGELFKTIDVVPGRQTGFPGRPELWGGRSGCPGEVNDEPPNYPIGGGCSRGVNHAGKRRLRGRSKFA